MTAQEMFEELDFVKRQYNAFIVYYDNKSSKIITFNIKNKTYYCSTLRGYKMTIDIKLAKAINKQLIELGWI